MKNTDDTKFFAEIPDVEFQKHENDIEQYDKQYAGLQDESDDSLTGTLLIQLANLKQENKI